MTAPPQQSPLLPPSPPGWDVVTDDLHADCVIFDVRRLRCRHRRNGAEADFFALGLRDWAVAYAVTPAGEVVVIEQFRFGTRALSWEVPAGVVDAGEDPQTAALRELKEETGFAGPRVTPVGSVHPNPALHGNRCHFFLVEDARPVAPPQWETHEEVRVAQMPFKDFHAAVRAGVFSHGMVPAGLFFLLPLAHTRGWL